MKNTGPLMFAGAIILLLLLAGLSSWFTIDETERGVITRNGALIGTAEPGLHFKIPLLDKVHKISVQSHRQPYTLASYSRDQQPANIAVSVTFHANAATVDKVYSEFKNIDNLVERALSPRIAQATKTIFGNFSASESIQKRAELNNSVLDEIQRQTTNLVTIEGVQIENIDFSDTYERSIEERMLAEVGVQKAKQELEQQKIQAEIKITQAEAEAKRVKLAGEAEAYAIQKKGEALRSSPELVKLTAVQKWDGVLPKTMLPDGTLPFIDLKEKP